MTPVECIIFFCLVLVLLPVVSKKVLVELMGTIALIS